MERNRFPHMELISGSIYLQNGTQVDVLAVIYISIFFSANERIHKSRLHCNVVQSDSRRIPARIARSQYAIIT